MWPKLTNLNNIILKGFLFSYLSDSRDVVCECNHLTNFGIIVDFIGAAPASDPGTELFVITLVITRVC